MTETSLRKIARLESLLLEACDYSDESIHSLFHTLFPRGKVPVLDHSAILLSQTQLDLLNGENARRNKQVQQLLDEGRKLFKQVGAVPLSLAQKDAQISALKSRLALLQLRYNEKTLSHQLKPFSRTEKQEPILPPPLLHAQAWAQTLPDLIPEPALLQDTSLDLKKKVQQQAQRINELETSMNEREQLQGQYEQQLRTLADQLKDKLTYLGTRAQDFIAQRLQLQLKKQQLELDFKNTDTHRALTQEIATLKTALQASQAQLSQQRSLAQQEKQSLSARIVSLEREISEIPLTGQDDLRTYYRQLRIRQMKEVVRLRESEVRLLQLMKTKGTPEPSPVQPQEPSPPLSELQHQQLALIAEIEQLSQQILALARPRGR